MKEGFKLARKYAEILKEFFGDKLEAVAIFGSLARGEAKFPGSDIDLLVILKGVESLSLGERIKLMMKTEKRLSETEEYAKFEGAYQWSPSIQEYVLTPEELKTHPPILLDLTTDIVNLYDTGILSGELEKLRRRLRELGARKVRTGDSWFWILKPDLKLGEEVKL
jgi:hypothetical protein